jgi:hypothetical protein
LNASVERHSKLPDRSTLAARETGALSEFSLGKDERFTPFRLSDVPAAAGQRSKKWPALIRA